MQTNELNANQKRALTALLSCPSLRKAAVACALSDPSIERDPPGLTLEA